MKAIRTGLLLLALLVSANPVRTQAQSYQDSVRAYRKDKQARFFNNPTTPLSAEDSLHLHYFEPDGKYRVLAKVDFLDGEKPFRMPTYDGTSTEYIRYARLLFTLDGEEHVLTVYKNTGLMQSVQYRRHLFLPVTDGTNGGLTYGGGRYLDLSESDIFDNQIQIDFNKLYNPYCAYSAGYRCPVPPAENHLDIPVFAGEKKYTGAMKQRPLPASPPEKLDDAEQKLILSGDTSSGLKVIQTTEADELEVLQKTSKDIDPKDEGLPLLARRMYLAMRDTLRPGVGIAAPQVGINRNLIWVRRFDKEEEPFELYLNPKITWRSKLLRKGREGCLSIPDTAGQVLRNYIIRLTYQDIHGQYHEEFVEGFTAVIFQHEVDHLLGILFTDRLAEQAEKHFREIEGELLLLETKHH